MVQSRLLEFGEEFGEVVVFGFPFDVVAGPGVHSEVVLVGGEALLDDGDDLGWGGVVAGDVDAAAVALGFERRDFGCRI